MKKILIAKQNLEKKYSGANRTVYEQIKYFLNKKCEVHVVAELITKDDVISAGAHSHKTLRLPWQKGIKRRINFSNKAQKIATKTKFDLIIGHGDLQHQDIFLLHNCVHLAEEKINERALSPDSEMYLIHTPILRNKQFKHLIANSQMMKDDLVSRFDIAPESITVIYPAVDVNQFRKFNNTKRDEIRSKLGIASDEFLVGLITSGNFKKRGVDRYLNAISLMPHDLANKTHFIFVGKDKLDKKMQAIWDECPYKERIHFLPVIDNVEEYFNALDIFILPARIEEFGRVVAEAMSCAAPIITTKWVGASELIKGKARDFIYDGKSDEELARLIEMLLSSEALRKEVGELNLASVQSCTEEEMFKRFGRVFSSYL